MRRRDWIAFFFWCFVFILTALYPIVLGASIAKSQDVWATEDIEAYADDADSDLGLPIDLDHPATGEPGTWIPRWLEREHLLDVQNLQACRKDSEFLELRAEALSQQHDSVLDLLAELERSQALALKQAASASSELSKREPRLARRLRAVWGLVGVSLGLAVTTAALVLR